MKCTKGAELALTSCAQARFSSSPNLQEKASLKSSVQDHFHIDIRDLEHRRMYVYDFICVCVSMCVYVCMCVCVCMYILHTFTYATYNVLYVIYYVSRVLVTYIYTWQIDPELEAPWIHVPWNQVVNWFVAGLACLIFHETEIVSCPCLRTWTLAQAPLRQASLSDQVLVLLQGAGSCTESTSALEIPSRHHRHDITVYNQNHLY